jgi:hypothetical protein
MMRKRKWDGTTSQDTFLEERGVTSSTDTASQDTVEEGGVISSKQDTLEERGCNQRVCSTAGNEKLMKCRCGDVLCTARVSMGCGNRGHFAMGHSLHTLLLPGQFVTMLAKPFGVVFEERAIVAGVLYRVVVGRDGVVKGGHAEANGNLKWGDIITAIDDEELDGESLQKVESVIEELGDSEDLHRVVWHRDWRDSALYMTGMSLL